MKRLFLFLTLLAFSLSSAFGASSTPPAGSPSTARPADTADGMVSITAKADTATPYQNQPILYTVRIVVRTSVSQMSLSDISLPNAIVETRGAPDISDEMERGVPVRVAEFHYIITPLQPGKVVIPPIVLQGTFPTTNLAALADPSGTFAISSGMRQSLDFFSKYGSEPFSVASNATQLNIKPPAAAMDPWLPLTSLNVREKIDTSRSVHVGDQLVRKITLTAIGAVGSQLPEIEVQQNHADFSGYSDRPTMGEDVDKKKGTISGWRTNTQNLIPQRPGNLVLPAIKVSWWNIATDKAAIAILPQRIVDVLPEPSARTAHPHRPGVNSHAASGRSVSSVLVWMRNIWTNRRFVLLYGLAGILFVALLLVFWRRRAHGNDYRLWSGRQRIVAGNSRRKKPVPGTATDDRLGQVHTPEELKLFLQAYAHRYCGTSKNAPLEHIFSALLDSRSELANVADMVIKEIGAALYVGQTVDIETLKKRSRRLIAALRRGVRTRRRSGAKLELLNPT